MEELIEKVEILKDELDKNKSIVNIKKLNKKIMEDKELITLLEKYKNTNNINVKEEIMSNKLFKKYKEEETNINFIILEINKRLKEINSKGKCHK